MRTQIIAELASNHGGDLSLAKDLISACADHGADWIKVQAYQTKYLARTDPQYDWLTQAQVTESGLAELKAHAEKCGVKFLASVFDLERAKFIRSLGCDTVKIGSGETARHSFHVHVLSLGFQYAFIGCGLMEMLPWLRHENRVDVVPFYGVSEYPTPEERAYCAMNRADQSRPWGWSDHTRLDVVGMDAIKRGASYVERHVGFRDRGRFNAWDSEPRHLRELRKWAEDCAWEGTAAHADACAKYLTRWSQADDGL